MKAEKIVGIEPAVLRWARESVGMSVEDVASKMKRQAREIESWENGSGVPTYSQLESLAYKHYKRPLAVFFLPAPPKEQKPRQEFRTLPDADMATLSRDTYLHIRKAHAYQVGLSEFYSGINPAPRRLWDTVGLSINDNVAAKAAEIRSALGVNFSRQSDWGRDDESLREWRIAIEAAGIFVFKDSFKQKSISGFCLRDENFPLVYINNSTTKTRQIFSLLHEVAHLLFEVNGISKFDQSYLSGLPKVERDIEVFCNAVASETLIPSAEFAARIGDLPPSVEGVPERVFVTLASVFGVSREAILRRFLDLGRVSNAFYESKAAEWTAQIIKKKNGGSWSKSKGAYLSDRLLKDVFARRYRDQISPEQAADYLGVKTKNLGALEEIAIKRKTA
jgi:Zn-dependent peptidase ImmA (M78 family)